MFLLLFVTLILTTLLKFIVDLKFFFFKCREVFFVVAEAVNVVVVVAEAVAEAVAVNVLVPMIVSPAVRGYESEGKWMFLFRDMICAFCINIAR